MKREFLSIFLSLSIFAAFIPVSAQAEGNSTFTDVTGTEYYAEASEALAQLNILSGYEDGSFGAEKPITRAEMAAVVCRMLGKEEEAKKENGETSFTDVDAANWASGYINYASAQNIINGDGDGLFRPNDKVRYEEAVKMIVCAFGLGTEVDPGSGDWAEGYIKVADDNGIIKNARGKQGEASSRGDVAVMVYDGLFDGSNGNEAEPAVTAQPEATAQPEQNETPVANFASYREEVISLVNEERGKEGLQPLTESDLLDSTAQSHSDDMVERNFFSHENPDGETPFDRMKKNGVVYTSAGENIAEGQRTPREVMDSWMHSEGHRANILNGSFNKIGVGITADSAGSIYWTQNFTGD